jgi:hypothetical protein
MKAYGWIPLTALAAGLAFGQTGESRNFRDYLTSDTTDATRMERHFQPQEHRLPILASANFPASSKTVARSSTARNSGRGYPVSATKANSSDKMGGNYLFLPDPPDDGLENIGIGTASDQTFSKEALTGKPPTERYKGVNVITGRGKRNKLKNAGFTLLTGAELAGICYTIIPGKDTNTDNLWIQDPKSDRTYANNIDKSFHLGYSNTLCRGSGEANALFMDRKTAALIGALYAGIQGTAIEIRDGYTKYADKNAERKLRGLSPLDLAADYAGVILGYLSVRYPKLDDYFTLKVSLDYLDLPGSLRMNELQSGEGYKDQVFWITVGPEIMGKILPKSIRPAAKYIRPAFGVSGNQKGVNNPWEFNVSLDIDMSRIPGVGRILNICHIPSLDFKLNR